MMLGHAVLAVMTASAMTSAPPPPPTPLAITLSDDAGHRLAPLAPVAWHPTKKCDGATAVVEVVQPLQVHQTIGGFGASFTESSAINLNKLPAAQQTALLELLFGASGVKLSAMKTTMLSNDFAAAGPWATYDDVPGDTSLANFSIARDLKPNGSLTLVKRAIAAGFDGTLQGYMDYPPDWMLQGKLPDDAMVKPELYDTLAHYYAKYIMAYASHGVTIDFLECFNEPTDSYTKMSPDQLIKFLGSHIGPLFDQLGLRPTTKLTYGGQCDRSTAAEYVSKVMADPTASKYMDVIAYHGYDCQYEDDGSCDDKRQNYDLIEKLSKRHPTIPVWLTEICYAYNGDDPNCTKAATLKYCTDYPRNHVGGAPDLPRRDFADGATWGHRIVKELQSGTSGWIYWNLLLDQHGGPFLLSPSHADAGENYQHPVVVVDTSTGTFHPTGLFYFLGHFAKFVRPGSARVGTAEHKLPASVSAVAFRGSTSSEDTTTTQATPMVLQLVNRDEQAQTVRLCSGGHYAELSLPPKAIMTAQWSA